MTTKKQTYAVTMEAILGAAPSSPLFGRVASWSNKEAYVGLRNGVMWIFNGVLSWAYKPSSQDLAAIDWQYGGKPYGLDQ